MNQNTITTLEIPEVVCPSDFSPLSSKDDFLSCKNGHRFSVDQNIPRLILSREQYADAFGEQWNRYPALQLDSFTNTRISYDRLKRCLGRDLWDRLNGDGVVSVLEVGCGAGRFTEVLLQLPAAHVTSTDLSSAVLANQKNCPQSEKHRVIQCDLNSLPFKAESFDVVICLGVIQHTPDPEKTIEALYRQVKPGQWLIIDHYSPNFSHYTKVSSLVLRPILKRLSPARGTVATEFLTKMFFPLHRMAKNHRLMQMIVSRFSPLLTYFQEFPELNDQQQYEWALIDTHDHLTDYYKHLRTVPQIRETLLRLKAQSIWAESGGNGVEARCQKPTA